MLFIFRFKTTNINGFLVNGRVNSFLRGSRKHDTDLRRKRKRIMKTTKEKFVEIDGRIN